MKRIEIETKFGKLSAAITGDTMYPGIVICVEREDENGKYDRQLALAECTPDKPADGLHSLRLLVWHDEINDDYTDAYTFYEDVPPEPPEVIWGKYLKYLRDWAEEKKDPGFMGCTPACYDEWLGAEYALEMEEK
jgi:hypothetical protein